MYSKTLKLQFDPKTFTRGVLPPGFANGQVAIDMGAALGLLGAVTVPNGFSLASTARHWASVRYISALAVDADLRVTTPFADLDPHQKSVLSDDFGVAVTTQWLCGHLNGFKRVVDGRHFILQYAHLLTKKTPPTKKVGPSKCPDFVVLDNAGKWHVIECKGTQSSLTLLRRQLERARQQKSAIKVHPALAGHKLAVGLYLVAEETPGMSRVVVQDPEKVAPLITLDDAKTAERATNRLTAARALGLAGFVQLAEELALVEAEGEAFRQLLTGEERRRISTPRSERMAMALKEFNIERPLFSIENREFSGRQISMDISLPELSYETRRLTASFGLDRGYLDAIRSTSASSFHELAASAWLPSKDDEGIVVHSSNDRVTVRQAGICAFSFSYS